MERILLSLGANTFVTRKADDEPTPITALPLLLLSTACGTHAETSVAGEAIDETTQAFGESGCRAALVTPDAVAGHPVSWTYSPTTYDNPSCDKAWIIDFGTFLNNALVTVRWRDPWRRNEVQCSGGQTRVRS